MIKYCRENPLHDTYQFAEDLLENYQGREY